MEGKKKLFLGSTISKT